MTTTELETVAHWIGGERLQDSERFGEVTDPATGAVTRRVAFASSADVDRAVEAATAGFAAWSTQSMARRSNVLFRFRELAAARADELARVITAEHGKTIDDARGEVQRGLEVVEFACGAAHLLKGEASEAVGTGVDSHSLRQPIGVAVGITPFNFPAMVPMWMFPLALACGNAFILKPSEKDPSPSLLMAEWLAEAGLPDGAFNVLHGDREAVEALLRHPGIAAVSFVGSTPVAKFIYETATAHGKRVQALGGAKNHAVVMPDADVEIAADAIASAGYGSAGQRCMAISAVVAVGEAGDALAEALEARVDAVQVGPGAEAGSEMGPLVTDAARDRVLAAIDAGEAEGAELRRDGRGLSVEGHEDGFWVGPTLLDRVTPEMSVYREEIFGPVLVLLRVETFEEALELVNSNRYGNGSAIFTADGRTAREFEQRVQTGMVGVNVPIPVPMAYYSFGGWKQSLFGDLHVHGREGVLFYTRGKVVTERWPDQARGAEYGFPTHR
ncbi:MAG TPA: CoA-acylating methylmalonate-semialdehyde dehydrogenase [Solirubrobacteraceae bacterium]|jgi:malonate-semialdehyde dehydrogenase (acetylating)/methylmalonate-semialdehyde dehydrogenase|nr:CoA-acylating methylmalonate-semialdehyde dehydrogenase [Solirubrobacteraceae bacterium]